MTLPIISLAWAGLILVLCFWNHCAHIVSEGDK